MTDEVTAIVIPDSTVDQDMQGRFVPGNRAAAKHLQRVPPDRWPARLTDAVETFYQNSIADDGGETEVPERRRAEHRYRAETHGLILAILGGIKHHGPTDRHGRLREAWLKRFEALVSLASSLDKSLGFARHARDVTMQDYLTALAEAQPETGPQAPQAGAWIENAPDRESTDAGHTDAPGEAEGA
jgi:hypothetical protein